MKSSQGLVKTCIEQACKESETLMRIWHRSSSKEDISYSTAHISETLKSVHKIAGSCLTFGLDDLASIARVCEYVLKDIDFDENSSKVLSRNKIDEIQSLIERLNLAAQEAQKEVFSEELTEEDIEKESRKKISHAARHDYEKEHKCSILLIEDDPVMQTYMQSRLSKWGAYVRVEGEGESGYDAALKEPFDLILLDGMLPDIPGFEVLEKLRKNKRFKTLPILMFTALDNQEDVAQAHALGITDYIMKPIEISLLFEKIEKYVDISKK